MRVQYTETVLKDERSAVIALVSFRGGVRSMATSLDKKHAAG